MSEADRLTVWVADSPRYYSVCWYTCFANIFATAHIAHSSRSSLSETKGSSMALMARSPQRILFRKLTWLEGCARTDGIAWNRMK